MANFPEPELQYHGEDPLTNVTFTSEKVKEKLSKLKPSAAPGPDKVWAKVLHSLADVLAEPLAHVFSKLSALHASYVKLWRVLSGML